MTKRILAGLVLLTFIGASFTAATVPVSPAYAAENEVIATPTRSDLPQYVAVTPDGRYVYASLWGTNTVARIDTTTTPNTVTDITAGFNRPTGLAVTPDGNHVYVANEGGNTVSVIDTTANPIAVSATVTVGNGPQSVAVNSAGTRVYVTNYSADTVSVIDTTVTPNAVVGSAISVGDPTGLAVHPSGNYVYVANESFDNVSVIDTGTNTVVGSAISVGDGASGVAVNPAGTRVYVTNYSAGSVSVIQTSDNTVVGSAISVGSEPYGIAVNPGGTRAYVATYDEYSVSVIDLVAASPSGGSSGSSGSSGGGGSASAVVEDETVVVQRPAPVRTFEPVQQPVATSSSSPSIGQGPTLLVGGKPSALQVAVPNSNRLEVREGDLSISLSLPVGAGNVKNEKGVTEAEIMAGSALGLGGSGLRPGTFAQVFLSLAGQDSVELGRYEIGEDGTFSIDVRLDTMPFTSMPVPIGPQVLQMVSYDEDGNQIVLDLLVNVTQPPLAPEFNRLIGEIPGLLPGSSLATRAGIPIPLTVTGLADQNLVVFDGDGWSMGLNLLNEDAMVEPTEGGAFVRLTRDEPFLITGEGFKFPSTVGVYIFSEPTLVGTVEVDADGTFAADFFIDAALVPTGEHTLQMQGVGEDGYVRAANLGISVGDSTVPVAAAGPFAPWWTLIFIGLGLVLFGSLRRWGPIRENFAHNLATVMVFLMATPAVILGWISTVTAVTWWGLALGLVAMVLYYFVRPKSGASLVR